VFHPFAMTLIQLDYLFVTIREVVRNLCGFGLQNYPLSFLIFLLIISYDEPSHTQKFIDATGDFYACYTLCFTMKT